MRTIVFLALCVGVLVAVGVVQFKKTGDKIDVSIDTGRLEEQAEDVFDAVKDRMTDDDPVEDAVDDAADRVRDAGHKILRSTRRAIDDVNQ